MSVRVLPFIFGALVLMLLGCAPVVYDNGYYAPYGGTVVYYDSYGHRPYHNYGWHDDHHRNWR